MLAACASNNMKHANLVLPLNSIGSEKRALANDMIAGVEQFITRNLNCSDWSLLDVTESKAEGQIVFTSDGQIFKGKVSEIWVVQYCGKKLNLSLEITPASQGGSLIRMKSLY